MEFLGLNLKDIPDKPCDDPIDVNVYDIHGFSRWTSILGLGLFHTGVVVLGHEFSYGGHDKESTGIYKIPPKEFKDHLGDSISYRRTLCFGRTNRTQREVYKYLVHLSVEFRGIDYNLLCRNCNHFAEQLLYFLVRQHLPPFINRLARCSHLIFSPLIPKSWVQYPMVSSASSNSSASPSEASVSSSGSPSKKEKTQNLPPVQQRKVADIRNQITSATEVTPAEMNFQKDIPSLPVLRSEVNLAGLLLTTASTSQSSMPQLQTTARLEMELENSIPRSRSLPQRLSDSWTQREGFLRRRCGSFVSRSIPLSP